MRTLTLEEFDEDFDAVMDAVVDDGESFIITVEGRKVADLTPHRKPKVGRGVIGTA